MLSQNIKRLRKKKGISQEKMARLADVSVNTIVKIENGANQNPTIETLIKVTKALDVEIGDLIK